MRPGHEGPVQPSERFVFCLQQQTVCALNDHCSANGHVSLINSNSSVIAHSLGYIARIPGSTAAIYRFLMDAAGDCKPCNHVSSQKV